MAGKSGGSRTSFEDYSLHELIELIEGANHEKIATAAAALANAGTQITEIATEINTYIEKVNWEGESGDAFRKWGKGLSHSTVAVGTYAKQSGSIMQEAAAALADRKAAMPKRSTKDTKKGEEHQAALTEIQKLSQAYNASNDGLANIEEPRFKPMPNVGIEQPNQSAAPPQPGSAQGVHATSPASPSGLAEQSVGPAQKETGGAFAADPVNRPITTNLDSVSAPPRPNEAGPAPIPDTGQAPRPNPGQSTGWPGGLPTPPPAQPGGTPSPRAAGRPPAASPTGRPSQPAVGRPPTGGTANPVGRPPSNQGMTGRPPAGMSPSRPGGAGTPGRSPVNNGMVGRPTNPPGSAGGRTPTGLPRTGRDGVAGGTPQRTSSSSRGSTRLPQGNVIGRSAPVSRSQFAPATPRQQAQPPAPQRGAPSADGVLGQPRATNSNRPSQTTFTRGGAGLSRNSDRDNQAEDNKPARPAYLTEDEETWSPRTQGTTPPVIQ